MPSPTKRTLDLLREQGYIAEVVEKRVPKTFIAKDLFGCIDILAIQAGQPVLGIQATSRANISARYKKSLALPELKVWLEAGCVFEVWGWALSGPRSTKKKWQPTIKTITLNDLKLAENVS